MSRDTTTHREEEQQHRQTKVWRLFSLLLLAIVKLRTCAGSIIVYCECSLDMAPRVSCVFTTHSACCGHSRVSGTPARGERGIVQFLSHGCFLNDGD